MEWLLFAIGAIILERLVIFLWKFFWVKEFRNSVRRWIAINFPFLKLKIGSIKSDIEIYLNHEIEISNEQSFGNDILINKKVKLEWIPVEEEESIVLEENQVVIRLGYNMDENRNYVEAIMRFLEYGFIPTTKTYLNKNLRKALILELIHKTMLDRGNEAFNYYNQYHLAQELDDPTTMDYMEKTKLINRKGFFTPILLKELNELSNRLARTRERQTSQLDTEIDNFIIFLYNIANKESYKQQYRRDPPLDFIETFIKVTVILAKDNISGHKNAIDVGLKKGAKNVYIAGAGSNIDITKKIYKDFLNDNKKKYSLIGYRCVDRVTVSKNGKQNEGKICLITRA